MAGWDNASYLRKCTGVQYKGIRLGSVVKDAYWEAGEE